MTPTDDVSITLQVQEWNAICDHLMNTMVWRLADPLLKKISAQAQAGDTAAVVPPPTNGVDSHAPN